MTKSNDLLVEIHTEELPPKSLLKLAEHFRQQINDRLAKLDFTFAETSFFVTPRRLAVYVKDLAETQPDQLIEKRGPARAAAFDAAGNPSQACMGFANSCGVTPSELITIQTKQGEWVGYRQKVTGKSAAEVLPKVIEESIAALPIAKRMRWGDNEVQFVRPVHSVILLYGDQVIPAIILGCQTGRVTQGHRFLSPGWITIPHASAYASLLETEGYVIADFDKRKKQIELQSKAWVSVHLDKNAQALFSSQSLLDEVTGLVEWPCAIGGHFDEAFLDVPKEVLISSMQDHQRYFPIVNEAGNLLPHFITISNMQTADPSLIIQGNERVLRARLSDAAFFYQTDKLESLAERVERLKGIVFQAKLGTLFDKSERLSKLTAHLAKTLHLNADHAARAGLLAKTDLTSNMVGEFPELQGVMGSYYAVNDNEPSDVAIAMTEQYLPRFAGDRLPENPIGQALALADRIDTLVGAFGVNQIPTGDKDPFGLRRAALGLVRILIEKNISLDLKTAFENAVSHYHVNLENKELIPQLLTFIQERLRAWYQEQGITADVFASVAALNLSNPLDIHERIQAVQAFKKLSEAEALSVANKRVSNILTKYTDNITALDINPAYFETPAEKVLADELSSKSNLVAELYSKGDYQTALLQLAQLRKPVDDFFDQVMVMTDNKSQRENRILLLKHLRALFLQVADIALLQQ